MTIPERFWKKVDITPYCWLWTGAVSSTGYSNFWIFHKYLTGHRYLYTQWVGEIPEGLDLDHLCRNRSCVNPAHLEPVTRSENVLRGISNDVHFNKVKTRCKRGHEFTPENTYTYTYEGRRQRKCKTCSKLRNKKLL